MEEILERNHKTVDPVFLVGLCAISAEWTLAVTLALRHYQVSRSIETGVAARGGELQADTLFPSTSAVPAMVRPHLYKRGRSLQK